MALTLADIRDIVSKLREANKGPYHPDPIVCGLCGKELLDLDEKAYEEIDGAFPCLCIDCETRCNGFADIFRLYAREFGKDHPAMKLRER